MTIDSATPATPPVLPPCQAGMTLGECIDATVAAFKEVPGGVNGLMLSVQSAGATVYRKGYGVIRIGGPLPTACNSFQIDSLTKAFTAFAVLRLYQDGTIGALTDPLEKYLPVLPTPHWANIQIDQLLAMASGIPDISSGTLSYQEALLQVATMGLKFAPGERYDYSNSNYFLLGELVDALSRSSDYATYAKTHVLDAFGMPNTGLFDEASAVDPATPYMQGMTNDPWRNPQCGYSAGGFASTMTDLEAFAVGIDRRLVLDADLYRAMWINFTLNAGGQGLFGYGWAVTTAANGRKRVQKNGGGYGWSSAVAYTPTDDAAPTASPSASVCVMMNGTGDANALVDDLLTKVIEFGDRVS
jgi:D-alanyl-D-alanine carboxypeptidase